MFVLEVTLSDLNLQLCSTRIRHFNIWLCFPFHGEGVRDDDVVSAKQERSGRLLAPAMGILQLLGIEDVLTPMVDKVHVRFEMHDVIQGGRNGSSHRALPTSGEATNQNQTRLRH